jgi:uncharacterized protein
VLIFRGSIVKFYRHRAPRLDNRHTAIATVIVGAILGVLVSLSSVGAGAVGIIALILLYPELPMSRVVGSDIAHAVPLALIAGIGHWAIGSVDWHIVSSLLAGSVPGIIVGSYVAVRISESVLRLVLAATLILVAGRLLYAQSGSTSSLLTAFTRRLPH